MTPQRWWVCKVLNCFSFFLILSLEVKSAFSPTRRRGGMKGLPLNSAHTFLPRVTLGHFHPCEQTQAGGWTDLTILFSFSILGMLFVIREIKWESKSATELYKLIVLVLFSVMRKHLLFLKRQSPIKSIKHQTL